MIIVCKNNSKIIPRAVLLPIFILVWMLLGICTVSAQPDDLQEELLKQQADSSEIKKIEDELSKYSEGEIQEILEGFDPSSIIGKASGGGLALNPAGILNKAAAYLFKEVYTNLDVLIKLIVLVALCAVLKNLQTSFMSENVSELAFFVCYIVIVSVAVVSFHTAMKLGMDIIQNMVDFMYVTVPVLITLLVSGGNITSGGIFQPVLISIVQVAATVFKNVFIPMVFFSTVLSLVNNISERIQISKLAGFIKQMTKWAMGLILTVFVAFISLQGTLGAVVDGVTSKTAKFALGLIPVAGSYLADAADTVVACTLLIKNAAGVAVMIGIIAICLVPLLKILAIILLYRLTCVLVEPIADRRITGTLNDIAGSITYVLGIAASVTFMFLISITVIIGAGNLSSMIR